MAKRLLVAAPTAVARGRVGTRALSDRWVGDAPQEARSDDDGQPRGPQPPQPPPPLARAAATPRAQPTPEVNGAVRAPSRLASTAARPRRTIRQTVPVVQSGSAGRLMHGEPPVVRGAWWPQVRLGGGQPASNERCHSRCGSHLRLRARVAPHATATSTPSGSPLPGDLLDGIGEEQDAAGGWRLV